MRINKVRLEIREAVLCASVKPKKPEFSKLDVKEQLAMLKKKPALIESIKRPTKVQLKQVLDTHPHALNKLPSSKRSEDLVIQAIRPEKRYLFGARDERANRTLKNVIALHPNTSFTPRVYHEIVRLMCGAPERTIKKLMSTFEKQKRKIPEELRTMVKRIKPRSMASTEVLSEVSMSASKSIVKIINRPYTVTVQYPDSPEFRYEYYIGNPTLFTNALKLQFNPGEFANFVKKEGFSVKKLKTLQE